MRKKLTTSLGGFTVLTSVHRSAFHVLGLVLLTSNVRDTILEDPLVGCVGISTATCASIAAVQHGLHGRNHISLKTLGGNLDAIGNGPLFVINFIFLQIIM